MLPSAAAPHSAASICKTTGVRVSDGMAVRGESRVLVFYREGVESQSPGSRSAPWVMRKPQATYREGVASTQPYRLIQPLRGSRAQGTSVPRVRCATLGYVIQRLWRKDPARRSVSSHVRRL